jgi:hypothetical protein
LLVLILCCYIYIYIYIYIYDLLHKGIIRKSKSPWSCSAFYVQKNAELERGAPRLVINYKPLNEVLEWIRYPIPNKRDLINRLSGFVIFSKFDMKSGFWQIQIHEKDKYKTANQANKDKKKAKYEMGNFCEQYGLPSIAPSKKHKKSRKHEEYRKHKKQFKRFKRRSFELNDFYKKEKRKPKKKFKRSKNNKDNCYKCGKPGHFVRDCKAKETIKSLKVSNEEKENLIRMLEIKDTEPSDYTSSMRRFDLGVD